MADPVGVSHFDDQTLISEPSSGAAILLNLQLPKEPLKSPFWLSLQKHFLFAKASFQSKMADIYNSWLRLEGLDVSLYEIGKKNSLDS